MNSELLTAKELAAALKMNAAVVLRWKRQGRIPAEIDGHCFVRFDLAKVRKALAKTTQKPAKTLMIPAL